MNPTNNDCPICSAVARREYVGLKGYIEDAKFDVYVCSHCHVSFVSPMQEEESIYDYIYDQSEKIPGYERYYRYSELVLKTDKPFKTLANAESPYWAIYKIINDNFLNKKENTSILEIGSGLGYLTYSLHKAGYRVTGLDISKRAVDDARKRYGDIFRHENLFTLAEKKGEKHDCIIMMEVLEHVTDPLSFLNAAVALLNPGGKLIVTTPNKTAVPEGVNSVWQSDFPPVHFWFFTEESVKKLVQEMNRKVTFFDFTEYSKKFFSPQYDSDIEHIQTGLPRLLKGGSVNPLFIADQSRSKLFGIYGRYLLSYMRRRIKKKTISSRSTTMCIIIE